MRQGILEAGQNRLVRGTYLLQGDDIGVGGADVSHQPGKVIVPEEQVLLVDPQLTAGRTRREHGPERQGRSDGGKDKARAAQPARPGQKAQGRGQRQRPGQRQAEDGEGISGRMQAAQKARQNRQRRQQDKGGKDMPHAAAGSSPSATRRSAPRIATPPVARRLSSPMSAP